MRTAFFTVTVKGVTLHSKLWREHVGKIILWQGALVVGAPRFAQAEGVLGTALIPQAPATAAGHFHTCCGT